MHSVRNRSHSPHASEGESVAEAARVLIDSIRFDSTGNPRITDEVRLSKCSLLLKRAPSARAAVLEVITRCIERNVMHLPVFKTNINDIRRDHYNKAVEVGNLKNTMAELNGLMVDAPKQWATELTIWAIRTITHIGQQLKKLNKYPTTGLIETTQFWIDQEVPSKVSNLIVGGILYGLENNQSDGVDFLMREALRHEPFLDWILACLAISKPRIILKRLLDSGFQVFKKSVEPDQKKAHLRALTIILEYLIEKKPDIVADCLFSTLEIDSSELVVRSLYMLELLSSSLKSEKIKLVHKIALQAGESLTPELINAIHTQRITNLPDLDLEEITNSISTIISGSSSLDLTRVFVSIFNGEGIFEVIDIEIRFIFRGILNAILTKLEEAILGQPQLLKKESSSCSMMERFMITEKLTIGDPAYRLLRLILLSTDLQSCVNCMAKLVLSVSGPSGQAALIQLLKETHTSHDISFVPNFLSKAFATTSDKKSILNNISVLVEEVPESSSNYDSGRNLLAQQVRKYLTVNIAMVLQFLVKKDNEMTKSALEVLARLQFESMEKPVSHLLLVETLTGCFFDYMEDNDELFRLCWKILSQLAKSTASFGLIMRKFFERLKNLSAQSQVEESKNDMTDKKHLSLFTLVRATKPKASNVMGVGQIGNGVKRIKLETNEDRLKKENINEMIAIFITNQVITDGNMNNVEFDRLNTVAGLLKELFCPSLIYGDTDWPPPTVRGVNRPCLERDIIINKTLPKCVFSLLEILSINWMALNRVSIIIRAILNRQLAFWEASRMKRTNCHPEMLQESVRIITILGKSGMIPEILTLTTEIYEHCSPYELFLLINSIWGFMHCNPPSQKLIDTNFENCNVELFLTDARNILLANIEFTGHIYYKFVK